MHEAANKMTGSLLLQCMYGRDDWEVDDIDVLMLSSKFHTFSGDGNIWPSLEQYFHADDALLKTHPDFRPHALSIRWRRGEVREIEDVGWIRLDRIDLLPSAYDICYPYWRGMCEDGHLKPDFLQVGTESGRSRYDAPSDIPHYASLESFVQHEADFAFCKVLFDGRKLAIYDLDAVFTRRAALPMRAFKRLPFYQPGDGTDDLGRMYLRCIKYRDRGFTIDTDMPWSFSEMDRLRRQQLEWQQHQARSRAEVECREEWYQDEVEARSEIFWHQQETSQKSRRDADRDRQMHARARRERNLNRQWARHPQHDRNKNARATGHGKARKSSHVHDRVEIDFSLVPGDRYETELEQDRQRQAAFLQRRHRFYMRLWAEAHEARTRDRDRNELDRQRLDDADENTHKVKREANLAKQTFAVQRHAANQRLKQKKGSDVSSRGAASRNRNSHVNASSCLDIVLV
jgi:hypothetical protein